MVKSEATVLTRTSSASFKVKNSTKAKSLYSLVYLFLTSLISLIGAYLPKTSSN
jgi:hypothetical protein